MRIKETNRFKSIFLFLILLILSVSLLVGCSTSNLEEENQALNERVGQLEEKVDLLFELITKLDETKKNISDDTINLEPLKLTNGQLLYTHSAIPMSIMMNDIMEDGFRVVGTPNGITIEYHDVVNNNPIAMFHLLDFRSVKKEQTTFPYNNQFVIGYNLPIAYQVEDETLIAKIEKFSCSLRINGIALYTCIDE